MGMLRSFALLCALAPFAAAGEASRGDAVAFGRVPLTFEPNLGQADRSVRYVARGPGYGLFLGGADAVLSLVGGGGVRMVVVGGDPACRMRAEGPRAGRSNYLRGSDPRLWVTDVPHVGRVVCESVYPGIDLVYYGKQHELEFDFVVAPGADPACIRLSFERGAEPKLARDGSLVVGSSVTLRAPVLSQGAERVEGRFELLGERDVGFRIGSYDPSRPLLIDPVLVYSTYLGGSATVNETPLGIAVDASGHAYVTGYTPSFDFPTANPLQPGNNSTSTNPLDAFITKFSATGSSLVYSTYLGGSSIDVGQDIAVDEEGCAYVAGYTRSLDFPTASALQPFLAGGVQDAFLVKVNAAGSALVYSTYLGGSGDEVAFGVAVDALGQAYITGNTNSADFPLASPFQAATSDTAAFVAKLDAAGGALLYSTYLGGAGGADIGREIEVDSSGNAVVVGWTRSATFPLVNPIQGSLGGGADVFVTRFSAVGVGLFSTYIGGSGDDYGRDIALDPSGAAYITGETASAKFPTTSAAYQKTRAGGIDAFVSKINVAAGLLVYSTYLGSRDTEYGYGIAVDSTGAAYVTGGAGSKRFPIVNAFQPSFGGAGDAFVTKLNVGGTALLYSSFLGGSLNDSLVSRIAVDASGSAYIAGMTFSLNFPTLNPFQATLTGGTGMEGFVTKISP